MDAIKEVENEVEKVMRLFTSNLNHTKSRIDQLIDLVEKTKGEINQLTADGQEEPNSKQQIIIQGLSDNLLKACDQIIKTHRDLHIPVSKIGRVINNKFSSDYACVSDVRLFQSPENTRLLDQALVDHLLRHGLTDVAKELIREAGLKVDTKEIEKFNEINQVIASLRKQDVQPALQWATKNRKRLEELKSPLEFKLHRINIIELYKQGIDKQFEIIQYARDNLQPLGPEFELDIQHLMGGIMYLKSGIDKSPYKSFLNPVNYHEIEEIVVSNACALLNLSIRSPITVAVEAGGIALPALININQILSNQGVQNIWQMRDELPVDIDLGRKLQFHPTFSCPILKQQSSEDNPPMRLVCGHVISREALHKLSGNNSTNKLKCPYCPVEQVLSDAIQIHF